MLTFIVQSKQNRELEMKLNYTSTIIQNTIDMHVIHDALFNMHQVLEAQQITQEDRIRCWIS